MAPESPMPGPRCQRPLDRRSGPGRVFDRTVGLEGVPNGYQAMADRESVKVMVAA